MAAGRPARAPTPRPTPARAFPSPSRRHGRRSWRWWRPVVWCSPHARVGRHRRQARAAPGRPLRADRRGWARCGTHLWLRRPGRCSRCGRRGATSGRCTRAGRGCARGGAGSRPQRGQRRAPGRDRPPRARRARRHQALQHDGHRHRRRLSRARLQLRRGAAHRAGAGGGGRAGGADPAERRPASARASTCVARRASGPTPRPWSPSTRTAPPRPGSGFHVALASPPLNPAQAGQARALGTALHDALRGAGFHDSTYLGERGISLAPRPRRAQPRDPPGRARRVREHAQPGGSCRRVVGRRASALRRRARRGHPRVPAPPLR